MAVYQCKMCGANLNIKSTSRIVVCEYCGTAQTWNDEVVENQIHETEEILLQQANQALKAGNFLKVIEYCEQVLSINPENEQANRYKLLAGLKVYQIKKESSEAPKAVPNSPTESKPIEKKKEVEMGPLETIITKIITGFIILLILLVSVSVVGVLLWMIFGIIYDVVEIISM